MAESNETAEKLWRFIQRLWWYTVLLASASMAAVLSFNAWRDLAIYCSISASIAWCVPIAVDVLGAGAFTSYVQNRDRVAHAISVATVAVSSAGNVTSHLLTEAATGISAIAPRPVVATVSSLAPLVLYLNAVLYERHLHPRPPKPKKERRTASDQDGRTGAGALAGLAEAVRLQGGVEPGAPRDLGTRPPEPVATSASVSPGAGGPRGPSPSGGDLTSSTTNGGGGGTGDSGTGRPSRRNRAGDPKAAGRRPADPAQEIAAWLSSQGYQPGEIGRPKLIELRPDLTEHQARQALAAWRANGTGKEVAAE